jgi:hypothetical protein
MSNTTQLSMFGYGEQKKRMIGEVLEINSEIASDFLLPRHYSGRIPSISKAFGWYVNGELKAVCTFGKPAAPNVCTNVCGNEYAKNVYELNRLCRVDGFKEPLSEFVSACLRRLRVMHWIIISYSDTAMNHHGYIYQACNFIYTGLTKEKIDVYTGEGKHARHYTEADKKCEIKQVRTPKHRYIYFCTYNKAEKKAWKDSLRWKVLPYPKGDNNPDYRLGDYCKPQLVTRKVVTA